VPSTFEELNANIYFKEKIRNWSMKRISTLNNRMLSELLCILKTEHDEFPQTATTFLQTKKAKNNVKSMLGANGSFGTYIYFGLEKVLKLMINSETYMEDFIEILVNIDGVQIYKNSKQQFWPILIMLLNKKYIVKPQVVAIYHGDSKPKSPTEFLDDFITELSSLMANKIVTNRFLPPSADRPPSSKRPADHPPGVQTALRANNRSKRACPSNERIRAPIQLAAHAHLTGSPRIPSVSA
jgi:hypothetical protein